MLERLVERDKSIFEPISKSNIKTCNETKKPRKNKKEDKQAFGVIATKPSDLREVLRNTSLFNCFCAVSKYWFLKSNLMKLLFRLPDFINDGKCTWNINRDEVTLNFECNYEEAETQMVLHAVVIWRCSCCCPR